MLPTPLPCQRIRFSHPRPLIVNTEYSCRPLLRRFLPVWECFGGGKSGFRRIDPHLQAHLEGLLAEVSEEVPHRLFAACNDVTIRSVVDRIGDLAEHRFHFLL